MKPSVRGPATLSSAFVVAALGVLSASAQLNPTVKVLPKPQVAVPPECEQGLAPAQPRAIIAETATEETKPARAAEPPTLDLKTRLRSVQVTAEHNDRDAFKAALGDAHAAVGSYPAGGERSAANDVVGVYNDLERLWDYQFTSPTGAFFDSSTDFVAVMRRYADYAKFIGDQTLNVSGQIVYPTAETRQFLVAEAARRLERLGVRTPARITQAPPAPPPPPPVRRVQPAPAPQPVPRAAVTKPKPAIKRPTKREARVTPRRTVKKPKPVKIAQATPTPPKPRVSAPAPPPAPAPVAAPAPTPPSNVGPPPTAATTTTAAEGRGATRPATPTTAAEGGGPTRPATTKTAAEGRGATSPSATTTLKPAAEGRGATSSATTAAEGGGPTSTATSTTATTATTAPAQNQPEGGGRMNLLFAIILIIIGIGVLIILFRASD